MGVVGVATVFAAVCAAVGAIVGEAVATATGVVWLPLPAPATVMPVQSTQLKSRTPHPIICVRRERWRNQRQNRWCGNGDCCIFSPSHSHQRFHRSQNSGSGGCVSPPRMYLLE